MPEWLIPLIGLVLINAFVWLYLWGWRGGKVNTRLNNLESKFNDPVILPQCAELFSEIKEHMAKVSTKVELMYNWMNEDRKNNEKKRTNKGEGSG